MNLTKNSFATGMLSLAENFHLNLSQNYSDLVFSILKSAGVDDEKFQQVVQNIILTKTRAEFPSLPSVADWLEILGVKSRELSLKETALVEYGSVLEQAKQAKLHQEAITFQNQITNAVVEHLGGLSAIQKIISDKLWYKNQAFFKKDFIEIWMAFSKAKKTSSAVFGTEQIEDFELEHYSEIIEGIRRFGTRKANVRLIKNPKRIIPDSSQVRNNAPLTEQLPPCVNAH